MIRQTILTFLFLVVVLSGGAQNVMISDAGLPNEPSIMMDPQHPQVILAGANINRYYISLDTGRTWTTHTLQSSLGVWGDPVMAVDTQGDFYFFHLSNPPGGNWIDRIVCQKTTDRGMTWSDGSFTGLNGTKAQDKHWCAIDPTDNTIYLTWTQFDSYGSTNKNDSSAIMFSKSVDAGQSWSPALRINDLSGDCIDSDNTVEGAVPAVGPNGEVYVSWAGPAGIVFDRSLDKGLTWLEEEIHVDPMPTGWDYKVPGILRSNGLPVTVCDLSPGPHRGTIYINWSDQRNGSQDTDIWLSKSTDGGDTWSAPVRINDDGPGKHQFFTWMAIDQTTGYLYFVFYDRRAYADASTDVYMALSTDGGETFINRKISEVPFIPNDGIFFGDYTNLTVHNGIVRPIWTRLHEGQLSIWTHLTTHQDILSAIPPAGGSDADFGFESYPNPAEQMFYVSYKLHDRSDVSLSILDADGKIVRHLLRHERRGYGKYVEKIEPRKLNIKPGIYFVQLVVNGETRIHKQMLLE